ncbi:hypothetical protein [Jannaschia sp. LMIT008]|uniref:hypothetical protein n=1 Tax=Jannaschia maritima TaxID=3032585 RepID=UPI00281250E9|nr:hypothetical protein [Jannaschia sp. LMIT008]
MSGYELVERGREYRDLYLQMTRAVFSEDAARRKMLAWDWLFDNPHSVEGNRTRLFVMERDGGPAAVSVGLPGRFALGGRTYASLSPMTTMAYPEHTGEGLRILRNYFRRREGLLTWGLTNSLRLNKVCVRMGASQSPPRTLRRHVIRPGSAVRAKRTLPRSAAAALDAVGMPILRAGALRSPRIRTGERIVAVERFGEEFDAAWGDAVGRQACMQARDRAFLNWRYVDCPVETYARRALYRDGTLVGFAALCLQAEAGVAVGRVTDIFLYGGSERDFALLLADANRFFRRSGCVYSEVVFGRSTALDAAAQRTGFSIRKDQRPAVMLLTQDGGHGEVEAHLRDLHMCRGDQDEDY